MSTWAICDTCGSVVAEAALHAHWHDSLPDPVPPPEPEETP